MVDAVWFSLENSKIGSSVIVKVEIALRDRPGSDEDDEPIDLLSIVVVTFLRGS
jgi:hypothetical protein